MASGLSLIFAIWAAGLLYALCRTAISLDINLHYVPTNCTVVSASYSENHQWTVSVNYPIPGKNLTYNSELEKVIQGNIYSVNKTLSCFVSLHKLDQVIEYNDSSTVGSVFGCLLLSLFCGLILLGLVADLFEHTMDPPLHIAMFYCYQWVTFPITSRWTRNADPNVQIGEEQTQKDSLWAIFKRHCSNIVIVCQAAVTNSASSIYNKFNTIVNRRKIPERYGLENKSDISRASSETSYRSTKKLLSVTLVENCDLEDQVSIDTNSL
ncbi:hypothetical protein BGW37DRAFT_491867 [Umbelopsis sp. PMI_123]|nr:hypothetical protein BGW37DRAFT_491867 [Umbelopsis sp. PMI_123]